MGTSPAYQVMAQEFGETMAREGYDLVYGGGRVGLMGVLASAVMKSGGQVIGIIPEGLFDKEVADQSITELRVVASMHERKALMEKLSDAFVALPGGWGTLDEFFEILTWSQIGLHRKPIALLNWDQFYAPILSQIEVMMEQGFVSKENRQLFYVAEKMDQFFLELKQRL